MIIQEKQPKRNQELERKKKIIYVGNLHENVTKNDLVKLFGLRTTNYLIDNCFIKMLNLQQYGNGHAFILAPSHVCDELVKLHDLKFNSRKIIIEEAKNST